MEVTLNGAKKKFASPQTLRQIINQFCKNTSRVIAEHNGNIVKSSRWQEIQINDGDSIELVSFVGGG